jgi:hypothetical protein
MIYKNSPKNDSPRKAAGQAAKKIPLCAKKKISRKEGEPSRSRPLCGFATLRLLVNKKKCLAKKESRQGQDPFAALRLCAFA